MEKILRLNVDPVPPETAQTRQAEGVVIGWVNSISLNLAHIEGTLETAPRPTCCDSLTLQGVQLESQSLLFHSVHLA